jgi:type 1 glutamine amidotransferase
MNWLLASAVYLLAALSATALADEPTPRKPGGYRVLMITQSAGFKHGSVTRKEDQLAPAERAVTDIGIRANLFRTDCSQDAEKDFTKENLQNYDIVFFYTTGNLPIKEENLKYFYEEWITKKGHGFIGAHSAADTYHEDKRYWDMMGGTFDGHPWGSGEHVIITVHDQKHPASKPWGAEFEIQDEIYQFKNWQPEKVRVLMSLNMEKTKLKQPRHVPILWVKNFGEGKVMHMSLGHNESVWTNEKYQESLLGGIRWVLNLEEGDAKPNPELSKVEEEKAKAAAKAL